MDIYYSDNNMLFLEENFSEPEAKLLDFIDRLGLEAELTQQQILEEVLIDPYADQ